MNAYAPKSTALSALALKSGSVQRTETIVAGPAAFSRLGEGAITDIMNGKVPNSVRIKQLYFDVQRADLPLTQDECSNLFGRSLPFFACGDTTSCGQQTNLNCGGSVSAAFLMTGIAVVATAESEAFAMQIAAAHTPAVPGPLPVVPGLVDTCEGYCGAVVGGSTPAYDPGAFVWGSPTWRILDKFFQNFRLQMRINGKFLVIDTHMTDVASIWTAPEFEGAGCGQLGPAPYYGATNNVMAAKNMGRVIVPPNVAATLPASIGECVTTECCIPPVIPGAVWGHPHRPGGRVYCVQPMCLLPQMRLQISAVNIEDASCYQALCDAATINCGTGSESFTPAIVAGGSCGLTCTIPGGSFNLGLVILGYELWPAGCVDFLSCVGVGSAAHAMYSEGPHAAYLGGLIKQSRGRLDGFLSGPPRLEQ